MKRFLMIFVAVSLLSAGTDAKAQMSAGGGFVSMNFSGPDSKGWDEVAMPGFYFGVNYDIKFSSLEGLTFEPGIYFQHYGKTFAPGSFAELSYRANYLSVPLNIKYTFDVARDFSMTGYTGPRFNAGFIGNAFDKTRLGFKNIDAQWGAGLAMTFADAIQIRVGYDLGLDKAIKDSEWGENLKIRRNVFHIGIGFLF